VHDVITSRRHCCVWAEVQFGGVATSGMTQFIHESTRSVTWTVLVTLAVRVTWLLTWPRNQCNIRAHVNRLEQGCPTYSHCQCRISQHEVNGGDTFFLYTDAHISFVTHGYTNENWAHKIKKHLRLLKFHAARLTIGGSVTLTMWHPLSAKVGTNFADKRR
jgi:hypothetical protein